MTTPSTQQASPEVNNSVAHTDADFQAAIALIESESEAEENTPVIEPDGTPAPDPVEEFEEAAAKLDAKSKPEVPKTPNADLDRHEKLLEKQRQIWQQQKNLNKVNSELAQLREENERLRKGASAPQKKEPKGELEETIDLDNEAEEWLTPTQLREKIKKELKEEFEKENTERMSKAELEAEVDLHKESISSHITSNLDKYPAIETFTDIEESMERIFQIQENDYRAKAERYGHEWAEENMASIEKAADAYEKHVAQKYAPKLKSERAQKFFKQHLSTQQDSTQKKNPLDGGPLNQTTQADDGPTDWDERVKWFANKL